jgi:hypothetical protein
MKTMKARVLILTLAIPMMFLILASAQPQTYNWATIAGSAGHSGSADGTNSAARFSAPGGMAVDSGGNLYLADQNNGTIRKLTPVGTNWVSSTIVAVDSAGNDFVADWGNNTIRKLSG